MIERSPQLDYHTFRFKSAEIAAYFSEPLFRSVIATDAFRRLRTIHFLGSIDYLVDASHGGVGRRHTRYDHSLAVATLAKRFALAKNISGQDYDNVVVAALLHDIGHAPLSHSLEPAFKNLFEINHHDVGEKILKGEVRLGLKLAGVLTKAGLNNFEVMALIAGHGNGLAKEPFARAINVDTIEGIIRSASYLHRKELVLSPVSVLDAFVELGKESQDTLDEFWMMKDRVYANIIQSSKGLMADFICKRYMEINAHEFNKSYYYGTEAELRRDHAPLFEALGELGKSGSVVPSLIRDKSDLAYTQRSFRIDRTVTLRNYSDVDRRYLQEKTKKVVEIRKRGGDRAHEVSQHPTSQKLL